MFNEMSRRDKIQLSVIWGSVLVLFVILDLYYRTFGAGNIWDLLIY